MSSSKRSVNSAKRSVNLLPEDLILEVFLRLPWKSFLRCRFVSKRLRESIDCPLFLKQYDIFHNYVSDFALMHIKAGRLFSMDFHYTDSLNSSKEKQVPIPYKRSTKFIGCCKGIVCLMVLPCKTESYILLNPFNRTFQYVEHTNLCCHQLKIESYSIGFGYDYATDDYKIMRMDRVTKGCVHYIEVYSMRRDSWKQLNGVFSTGSFAHLNGICIEGAIHWLWLNDVNAYSSIAAFDLKTDVLRILPLPPHHGKEVMSLNDLGGRLSVFVKSKDRIIVWVIEEYGVDETSWTRMLDIVSPSLTNLHKIKLICYFPMWDGERFLCFGSDFGLSLRFNTGGCSMNNEIHMLHCYAKQPWVCVRSALRLPCMFPVANKMTRQRTDSIVRLQCL